MPTPTTNWNLQKPLTGEQDLAENVATAYTTIDGALLTPNEKKVTKGDYSVPLTSGLIELADIWDSSSQSWMLNQACNAMHRHATPGKVRKADESDKSKQLYNALSIKRHKGHNADGSDKGFYASDDFDGLTAKTVEVSASDHTHSIRDIPNLPWVYSGTVAPESAGLTDAQVGDIYIRFVE